MQLNSRFTRYVAAAAWTAVVTSLILAGTQKSNAQVAPRSEANQPELHCYTDFEQAKQVARELQRPMMVVFR